MDLFPQLNFHYPGTSNAARSHVSQQPQAYPHHMPVHGSIRVGSSASAQSGPSLDLSSDRGLLPIEQPSVAPRGLVQSIPSGPVTKQYMDESPRLPEQYVPSSSDKITCTDHRPLDEIFGDVRPPTAPSQVKSDSIHSLQNGTTRRDSRHTMILTYPLPARPQVDGVLHIPLLAVDNRISGTDLVVDFRCSDWGIGIGVEGIPMSDLLHGNVSGLEDPYQRVLDGFGLIDLWLNILWPHYPPFVKVISAYGIDGKPITRAELGYEVSFAFAEFFYQITSNSIRPAEPGPYEVSSAHSGSPSHGINFAQLHLITVRNTSRGEWTAEIRAVSMS